MTMPIYANLCQSMPIYANLCQSMPIYANLCQSMPIYCTCPVICMLSLLPGQIDCQIKLLKQVIYGGRALEADFDNLT